MSKWVALMKPGGASAHDFGSPYPLRPERFMLTHEHVRELGLDQKSNVFEVEPRLATTEPSSPPSTTPTTSR